MIIKYKYGIDFEGVKFGWMDNKLFKLPQTVGKRFYPLKELPLITVGKQKGYLLNRRRKSLSQLESMTIYINFEHQMISTKDTPF